MPVQLLADVLKSFKNLAVALDSSVPHRRRADPKVAVAVQRAVNYHFLKVLRVLCNAEHLVHIAFEMAVFAKFYVHIIYPFLVKNS